MDREAWRAAIHRVAELDATEHAHTLIFISVPSPPLIFLILLLLLLLHFSFYSQNSRIQDPL